MTILLVPNLNKPQAQAVCLRAAMALYRYGAQVLLEDALQQSCPIQGAEYLPIDQAMEKCDAIVTIGGDGTILRAARDSLSYQKPLLGINLGRMGFLATCEVGELDKKLGCLVRGEYMANRRMLLEAVVCQPDKPSVTLTALNEVVLFKGLRTQTMGLEVFCDETPVSCYRGDGVVLATPTGSTAYSLSAGGPILDASISGILFTPICAHSLQNPPMVFSARRRLRVQVESETDEPVYLAADGHYPPLAISPQSRLELGKAAQEITLVQFSQADQFEAIDKKLIRKITL